MDNKPILFEDKMKYRDNDFLYDKCIKQHDCIINYQWKMREYKDRINKAIEYIEENCMFHNENNEECYFNYGDDLSPKKLVDILKGSEE